MQKQIALSGLQGVLRSHRRLDRFGRIASLFPCVGYRGEGVERSGLDKGDAGFHVLVSSLHCRDDLGRDFVQVLGCGLPKCRESQQRQILSFKEFF